MTASSLSIWLMFNATLYSRLCTPYAKCSGLEVFEICKYLHVYNETACLWVVASQHETFIFLIHIAYYSGWGAFFFFFYRCVFCRCGSWTEDLAHARHALCHWVTSPASDEILCSICLYLLFFRFSGWNPGAHHYWVTSPAPLTFILYIETGFC